MVEITRPLDVPHVRPANEYRPTPAQPDPTFTAVFQASEAVRRIVDTAREQQIDNDVRINELNLRTRLDSLRSEVERDPNYATMPERWTEAAQSLNEELSAGMTSPMHQRLWRERSQALLSEEGRHINERTQIRAVEQARAGLITNVGALRRVIVDPNATPEARASAMRMAESAIAEAAIRRTLNTDDAATTLEGLRNAQAEFQRSEGVREESQLREDQIWTAANGDYATAIAMARDIENPLVRDNVEDRIATRHAREEAAASETLESAMEHAYSLINGGGTLEDLTPEEQRVINATDNREALRNYIASRATPASSAAFTATSTAVRDTILGAAANSDTAQVVAEVDLNRPLTPAAARVLGYPPGTVLRSVLTPGHYNDLVDAQREARGEAAPDGSPNAIINNTFNNRLLPRARQLAAMAGVNVQPNNGNSEDAQNVRAARSAFEGYLMGELRAHVQTYGSPPDDTQIDAIARSALTRSSSGGVMGLGRSERYRFEARPDAPVNVPYENILPAQRERLIRAWARQGNTEPPTPEQIARMYSEEIVGQAYDGN